MNGLAIIEKTDTETKGFFIDQDTIECARLNAKTKKRVERSEAARRMAEMKFRKAEKEKARRKASALKIIFSFLLSCAVCGGVSLAGRAELVAPIIWIPVGLFALCTACALLGVLFGKGDVRALFR